MNALFVSCLDHREYKEDRKTQLVSIADTMRHEFIQRQNLPTSPVVYTDGCCLSNGTSQAIGGIGVYWAPCHPK